MNKDHFIVAILLLCPMFSAAESSGVTKYRNFTPTELATVPQERRSAEVPMMYIIAAQTALQNGSQLLFRMQLNQLMYPGVENYENAVKAFQRDLGDSTTGNLTVYQISQLQYRSELQKLGGVGFPTRLRSSISKDYASVEGTVEIIGERIAWPINQNRIVCFRSNQACEVREVSLVVPNQNSWAQTYSVVIGETEYYQIRKWTESTIEADYPSKPDSCRSTSLSLNFKTAEFYFITKNAGGNCEFLGAKLDRLPRPRISQVVDGQKIVREEFDAIGRRAYEMLSSDYRRRVEALSTEGR